MAMQAAKRANVSVNESSRVLCDKYDFKNTSYPKGQR